MKNEKKHSQGEDKCSVKVNICSPQRNDVKWSIHFCVGSRICV